MGSRDGGDADDNTPESAREEQPAPRRRGRPRKETASEGNAGDQGGIDVAVLPPALSAGDDGEEAPKPRRRRAPRAKAEESDGVTVA